MAPSTEERSISIRAGVIGLVFMASVASAQQGAVPPGHPPIGNAAGANVHSSASSQQALVGTVVETMDASSYTYVQVDSGTRSVWAAAPRFAVKKGDRVSVPTHSPMQNYRSDSLGRTFPLVYFAEEIRVASATNVPSTAGTQATSGDKTVPHPSSSRSAVAPGAALEGIAKAEGGHTVGQIYDEGRGMAGSEVAIRGRVVKYSPRIMGKNWLHLQDGTKGRDGSNDLVVTSDAAAAVGDLVLVRGRLSVDRDFGHGYTYELIIEDAKVTVE